jgi:hypothetical protein
MTQTRAKQNDDSSNMNQAPDDPAQLNFKTPSWFVQEPQLTSQDLHHDVYSPPSQSYIETPSAQAYEAYKLRLEQRFRDAQAIYDQPNFVAPPKDLKGPKTRRPTLPLHEINGRKRLYQMEQQDHVDQMAKSKTSSVPWARMISLGAAAICIGAVAGYGVSNGALVKQQYQTVLAMVQKNVESLTGSSPTIAAKPVVVANHESVITKKVINTATLDVNDVRGTMGGMIPLLLTAQNADSSEPISLKITGLPDQAYLTAGVKSAQGSWTLKPSELGDVKLVVPQSDVNRFEMEVAAVEDRTGALAAPIKAMNVDLQIAEPSRAALPLTKASDGKVNAEIAAATLPAPVVVSPVNAAPETATEQLNQPSAIPTPKSEAEDLVAKGNVLLESGDIVSARQFFLRASEMGNAQGSFGVGRSYDPKVFAQLNVVGLQPDAAVAADWYKKAAAAGVVASTQ